MINYKKALLLVFIVSLVGLLSWKLKTENRESQIQNERVVQTFKAGLTLEDGKNNPTFDITQYIGLTALEATHKALSGNVKTQGTNENAFVTSLNGRDADTKKHEFWEFIVNGKQAEVGAGSYKIQNGDIIYWKISTY
jgi:hypothetical protein